MPEHGPNCCCDTHRAPAPRDTPKSPKTALHWENVVPLAVGQHTLAAIDFLRSAHDAAGSVPDAQQRIANALLALGEQVSY